MRYLNLAEVLALHQRLLAAHGGAEGVRDLDRLQASIAQPRQTFGGEELYPTLVDKAVVLAFGIVTSHPFVDGNKRAGHAAMETMLILNGFELDAEVDDSERVFMAVAAGEMEQDQLLEWVKSKLVRRD